MVNKKGILGGLRVDDLVNELCGFKADKTVILVTI